MNKILSHFHIPFTITIRIRVNETVWLGYNQYQTK